MDSRSPSGWLLSGGCHDRRGRRTPRLCWRARRRAVSWPSPRSQRGETATPRAWRGAIGRSKPQRNSLDETVAHILMATYGCFTLLLIVLVGGNFAD